MHRGTVTIDTFSDRKIVFYIVQLVQKHLNWTIRFNLNFDKPNPLYSKFFNNTPRHYSFHIKLNELTWLEYIPNEKYTNPIRTKKDVDELIKFIIYAKKHLPGDDDLIFCTAIDINSDFKYIEFIESLLPLMEGWKFLDETEEKLKSWKEQWRKHPSVVPQYLILNHYTKRIHHEYSPPSFSNHEKIYHEKIHSLKQLYDILEMSNKISEQWDSAIY